MGRQHGPHVLRWTETRQAILTYLWVGETGQHMIPVIADALEIDHQAVRYNLIGLTSQGYVTHTAGQVVKKFADLASGSATYGRQPDLWQITEAGCDKAKSLSLEKENPNGMPEPS